MNEHDGRTVYKSEPRAIDGWAVYIYAATFGTGLELVGAVGFEEDSDMSEDLLDIAMGDLGSVAENTFQY